MKVLLADDDSITRAILVRQLQKWGYEVILETDGARALDTLARQRDIRLCILDWMMPGLSGLEICRSLRQSGDEPYVYAILLTKTEMADIVAGLEAGADDYLTKPCNPFELEVRLRSGRRIVELQESLIAAREQLRVEATHDALTTLLNRKAALDALTRELRRAERHKDCVSVIMLDIDHFKSINDTYGHAAGDEVLRAVARRTRGALRTYDICGRLGGEEFVVVVSCADGKGGVGAAERARRVLEGTRVEVGKNKLSITASLGVACSTSGVSMNADDLIRAADSALYRAKRAGRNRVIVAERAEYAPVSVLPHDHGEATPSARTVVETEVPSLPH